jgi:hypothetical protein
MTKRARRAYLGTTLVLATSAAAGAYYWHVLADESVLTTSYSTAIPHRRSLPVDAYELVTGVRFFRNTAHRLVAETSTDSERLSALMTWTHENVRPQYAAPERVVADTFVDIVRRGHGYCDQTAHVFATLAHFAGYDVRLLFLRRPDGVSPHTVAEVLVDDRWVIVDPWLGVLFRERSGRLAGRGELGVAAELPGGYEVIGSGIDAGHFQRGTVFETFPYQAAPGLAQRVWRRIAGSPTVAAPPSGPRVARPSAVQRPPDAPRAARSRPAAAGVAPAEAVVRELDSARWAHLEARYTDAIVRYRELLRRQLPADTAESIRFFLGLALLRSGSSGEAVAAFDTALEAEPDTAWRRSILFYRAEARILSGDLAGAAADFRASGIPPAAARLEELGQQPGTSS